jgi:hypothetical protein
MFCDFEGFYGGNDLSSETATSGSWLPSVSSRRKRRLFLYSQIHKTPVINNFVHIKSNSSDWLLCSA